jgi:cytoskeletal protein CcmA (bactofilin family)
MDHHFYRSLAYWQSGHLSDKQGWSLLETGDHHSAQRFHDTRTSVLVGGACQGNLVLQNGGLLQIYGDLNSTVEIGAQGEIVIGGDVSSGGVLQADGIQCVFIGGDLSGSIRSHGSLHIWVCGNLDGQIQTGDPITRVYAGGDVTGRFEPTGDASLLYLDVDGFMAFERLTSIANQGYTEFNASVNFSDQPPGIYPDNRSRAANDDPRCQWTIHHTRESTWNLPPGLGPRLSHD